MPADGADFQKRRPAQGRFFKAVKNGAASDELGKEAAEAFAKRIAQEKMPMFRPAVDLALKLLTEQPLLTRAPNAFAKAFRAGLAGIESQFAELSITREVCKTMERVVLQVCADGAPTHPTVCRSKIFEGFHDAFLKVDLLDRARNYTLKCRDMDKAEYARFEQRITQQARPDGIAILESVYESPKGVPSSKWKKREPKISHTTEALHNEVLASQGG